VSEKLFAVYNFDYLKCPHQKTTRSFTEDFKVVIVRGF